MTICARATALLLLLAPMLIQAANLSPREEVQKTVDRILEILKAPGLDWDARQQRIAPIVDEHFDFRSMSQSVLSTHWRKASPAERERFVQFFSQYLELTYLEKAKNYSGETVRYGKEKIRGDKAVVETFIVSDRKEIPVTYKLHQGDDGQWRAYDVDIEGVSLISNYRSVYSSIIKSEGMSGLLIDLQDQVRQYEFAQDHDLVR